MQDQSVDKLVLVFDHFKRNLKIIIITGHVASAQGRLGQANRKLESHASILVYQQVQTKYMISQEHISYIFVSFFFAQCIDVVSTSDCRTVGYTYSTSDRRPDHCMRKGLIHFLLFTTSHYTLGPIHCEQSQAILQVVC